MTSSIHSAQRNPAPSEMLTVHGTTYTLNTPIKTYRSKLASAAAALAHLFHPFNYQAREKSRFNQPFQGRAAQKGAEKERHAKFLAEHCGLELETTRKIALLPPEEARVLLEKTCQDIHGKSFIEVFQDKNISGKKNQYTTINSHSAQPRLSESDKNDYSLRSSNFNPDDSITSQTDIPELNLSIATRPSTAASQKSNESPSLQHEINTIIRFVSSKKFNELIEQTEMTKEHKSDAPWSSKTIVQQQTQAYTDGAYNCTIAGISSGDQVTLAHLEPVNFQKKEEQATIENILTTNIKTRQEAINLMHVLLTGGRSDWAIQPLLRENQEVIEDENQKSEQSKFVKDTLINYAQKSGIPPQNITELWGRRDQKVNGSTDALFISTLNQLGKKENIWYIHAQRDNPVDIKMQELSRQFASKRPLKADVESLKDLKYAFKKIRLAHNAYLEIGEEIYDTEHLRQSLERLSEPVFDPEEK